MDFCFAHLKWLPVAIALAVPGSAVAQGSADSSGQAILFSTPAGDGAGSNAPAFAAPDSRPHDFADQFQAPASFFDTKSPDQFPLPAGGPAISSSQARRQQKLLEDRKNWALLTPEEILGVATPEKILGDATQDKSSQSPTERFLARQQMTATNSFYNNDPAARWFLPKDKEAGNADGSLRVDVGQFLNRFGSAMPDNNPFAAQNQDSSWFNPPAPAMAKPDPAQVAAMDRFRQLLTTGSLSDAPEKSSPGGKFLSAQPLSDPNLQPLPVVNRFGATFTPLSSGISRPAGLTALPGITRPIIQPIVTPSWAPQPPPWQNPQPGAVPQRKF